MTQLMSPRLSFTGGGGVGELLGLSVGPDSRD